MLNQKLKTLLDKVTKKKQKIDALRPLPSALIKNLNQWYKVELTYSSNAIEGNTLTSSETAQIIEKGLTIGGKTVTEHLEAINHAYAVDYILELARSSKNDINLKDILDIHRLVLKSIDDQNAGRLRKIQVKIAGADVTLPDPIKLQELMDEFITWLYNTKEHPVLVAADAHLNLVLIHPFVDGNGRTARLLMNLLLLQTGYPIALIMPEQRAEYIESITRAQKTDDRLPYYRIIINAVEKSLDIYLDAITKSI